MWMSSLLHRVTDAPVAAGLDVGSFDGAVATPEADIAFTQWHRP
jgi:hypothetical protein